MKDYFDLKGVVDACYLTFHWRVKSGGQGRDPHSIRAAVRGKGGRNCFGRVRRAASWVGEPLTPRAAFLLLEWDLDALLHAVEAAEVGKKVSFCFPYAPILRIWLWCG
jgi:hypothetical protein